MRNRPSTGKAAGATYRWCWYDLTADQQLDYRAECRSGPEIYVYRYRRSSRIQVTVVASQQGYRTREHVTTASVPAW